MIGQQRFLKLNDGLEIFCNIREVGSKIWVVATHGIGEHQGRHRYLTDMLGHGLNVFQYDLRGHGKSGGERGDIADFSQYMRDLSQVLAFLKREYRMERFVLFGHSMGALITAGFMQSHVEDSCYPERVFLSAPPAGLGGPAGPFARFAPMKVIDALAALPVGVRLPGLVDLKWLSHDPLIQQDYISDPLNSRKLHTRLVFGLARTSRDVFSRPLNLKCETFVAVGGEDQIVHPPSVEEYFTAVEKNVTLKVIPGAYHEMHNEIDKYRKPYFNFLKSSLHGTLYNPLEENL